MSSMVTDLKGAEIFTNYSEISNWWNSLLKSDEKRKWDREIKIENRDRYKDKDR